MANIKISDLTSAASASSTQEFEVNDSGTSKKVTGAQIADYVEGVINQLSLDNTGLQVKDTDASHTLTIKPGSNLTANKTLTVTTGDADRTLDISAGSVTITSAGAAILDDANAAAQRTTLGLGTAATLNAGTSANNLVQLDGSAKLPAVDGSALTGIVSGGNYVMQAFTNTTPGGVTWTKPAGLKAVKVTVVGGGGGAATVPGALGEYTRGGAGAGGAAIEYIPAPSIPGPVTVTVGVGGPATAPTAGGTSSFGTFCSATGGSAGAAASPSGAATARGGAGGAGSGGTINFTGQSGGATLVYGSPTLFVLGSGGSSILGGGAQGLLQNDNATAGLAYGGGAPGLSTPNTRTGAAGGQGIVIVEEFY